jgi:hypothetical protein
MQVHRQLRGGQGNGLGVSPIEPERDRQPPGLTTRLIRIQP